MDELLNETYIIERDYNGELIDETVDQADYVRPIKAVKIA